VRSAAQRQGAFVYPIESLRELVVKRRALETHVSVPRNALDVLAQQIVAIAATLAPANRLGRRDRSRPRWPKRGSARTSQ